MNVALAYATGDVVVRVDGHTVVAPDYLRACVASLREHRASVVGGGLWPVGVTATGKAIAAAGRSRFAVPSVYHVATKGQYTDSVYMGAWPRAVLTGAGGFDASRRQRRLRTAAGVSAAWWPRYFDPAIAPTTTAPRPIVRSCWQYFAYGTSKMTVLDAIPGRCAHAI